MTRVAVAALLSLSASAAIATDSSVPPAATPPRIAETRTYRIRQTVTLKDVPASAKQVRMWVPIPGDGSWQRVLDRRVVEAPEGWTLEHEPVSDADLVYATAKSGADVKVVVETLVVRQSPVFDLSAPSPGPIATRLFHDELAGDAPLMSADDDIRELAAQATAGMSDPRRKVVALLDAVANAADHYSKDPKKPSCGRGSAQDCMEHGGGCCTDLHSLFIAAARDEGIPARMQYGYRLKAEKAGSEYDPSYRCWVEYNLPGLGWVPTDLVVADAGEPADRAKSYGTLDARRVWLWQGRSLTLEPKQAAPAIQTMSAGWAEIDGVPVDVLPAKDGSPSKLSRTITFTDLTPQAGTATN